MNAPRTVSSHQPPVPSVLSRLLKRAFRFGFLPGAKPGKHCVSQRSRYRQPVTLEPLEARLLLSVSVPIADAPADQGNPGGSVTSAVQESSDRGGFVIKLGNQSESAWLDAAAAKVATEAAEIDIQAAINAADPWNPTPAEDADTHPVLLTVGDAAVWTYLVRNSGDASLENVRVIDNASTSGDPRDDVVLTQRAASDKNQNDRLDPGETWLFVSERRVRDASAATNVGIAMARGEIFRSGGVVTDDDVTKYFGFAGKITVEKAVNADEPLRPTPAEDADNLPVSIDVGSAVTWSYIVSSDANLPLAVVSLVDDAGTPDDRRDDFTLTNPVGDDGNGLLDPSETWLFLSDGEHKAGRGLYTNTATVTAKDALTRSRVLVDTDSASYVGVGGSEAIIRLEKAINAIDPLSPTKAEDADEPTGPVLAVGTGVTWTYLVSNLGDVPLQNIVVRDDHGTPLDASDDFLADAVETNGFQVGDDDKDDVLDVGEVWLFTSAGTAAGDYKVVAGQYTNTATASGDDLGKSETVRDRDSSNHFGVRAYDGRMTGGGSVFTRSGMRVTHGFELHADPAVGPNNLQINFDGSRFHLERLTEALAYDDPAIDDGPGDAQFDTLKGEGIGRFNGEQGYRVKFLFSDAGEPGWRDFARIQIIDPSGDTVLFVAGYLDHGNHQAHAGTAATVTVEKAVNADDPWRPTEVEDADVRAVRIEAGSAVTWSYLVSSDAIVALDIRSLIDDAGTPDDDSDDFVLTKLAGGDDNGNELLDPGETWLYLSDGKHEAQRGLYTNTVTVTAKDAIDGGRVRVDADSASYFGFTEPEARIRVEKAVNARDPLNPTQAEDADEPTGPVLTVGTEVTWTYLVSNEGDIDLKDIRVHDDHGTLADTSDDFDARAVLEGGFRLGDVNQNNILDVGEVWLYTSAGTSAGDYTVLPGQYTNTATVRAFTVPASGLDTSTLVIASDQSNHFGVLADGTRMTGGGSVFTRDGMRVTHAFELHGDPAIGPNSLQINFDGNRFHLEALTQARAYDDPEIDDPSSTARFDALSGEGVGRFNGKQGYQVKFMFTDAGEPGTRDFARIQILDPDGETVLLVSGYLRYGNHQAHPGEAPAITVDKAVNAVNPWQPSAAEDADRMPLRVTTGTAVTWSYLVRSSGSLALANVAVVDDAGTPDDASDDFILTGPTGGDRNGNELLDPGETWLYLSDGTHKARSGLYTNIATVTAADASNDDRHLADTDPASYFGVAATPVDDHGEEPKGFISALRQMLNRILGDDRADGDKDTEAAPRAEMRLKAMLIDSGIGDMLSNMLGAGARSWSNMPGVVLALAPANLGEQSEPVIDLTEGLASPKSPLPVTRSTDSGSWLDAFVNNNGSDEASASDPISTLEVTLPVTSAVTQEATQQLA